MIRKPFVTSSSPNQFVQEIVSPLPCSSVLVRHILLFFFFFFYKELVSFMASLDKCHTSVFNALIIKRYLAIIKHWFKLLCTNNIILRHIYSQLLDDCCKGVGNWLTQVKDILFNNG